MGAEGQVSRLVASLMFFGLLGGCLPSTPSKMATTRVTGASMAPTIWGESMEISCPACTIHWRVNWQSELRPQRPFPCWNCGHKIDHSRFRGLEYSKIASGDQIFIDGDAYREAKPQVDEMVAIGDSESLRIKRIVATEGDVVSHQHGILYRNELPVVSGAPWIIVHDDRYRDRDESWWTFDESLKAHGGEKLFDGFRVEVVAHETAAESPGTLPKVILFYQHRSPYNGLKPERVGDDYPANLNESRRLQPVDSLGLRAMLDVEQTAELRCWLWKSNGPRCEVIRLLPGSHALKIRWPDAQSIPEAAGAAPEGLEMQRPICIEVLQGALSIRHLQVERPIQYTIDIRRSDAITLPLRLKADQYFVVGDNAPLSIDSRYEGPINRSEIIGRVNVPNRIPNHETNTNSIVPHIK